MKLAHLDVPSKNLTLVSMMTVQKTPQSKIYYTMKLMEVSQIYLVAVSTSLTYYLKEMKLDGILSI